MWCVFVLSTYVVGVRVVYLCGGCSCCLPVKLLATYPDNKSHQIYFLSICVSKIYKPFTFSSKFYETFLQIMEILLCLIEIVRNYKLVQITKRTDQFIFI